jgi:hypothetical protein
MVPLSLFATARRHWTWLRSMSSTLPVLSWRPVYTGLKSDWPTGQSLKWMRECEGGRGSPTPAVSGSGGAYAIPRRRHSMLLLLF